MKLSLIFTSIIVLLTSVHSEDESVGFDWQYDQPYNDLSTTVCGPYYLAQSPPTIAYNQIPNFPHIGAIPGILGDNLADCGTCWLITYGEQQLKLTAMDASNSILISSDAMNALTGNQAESLGSVTADVVQIDPSNCQVCKLP